MLTVEQARRELSISRSMIYHLIWTGQLKASKFGRIWRIARSDLDKFKEASAA